MNKTAENARIIIADMAHGREAFNSPFSAVGARRWHQKLCFQLNPFDEVFSKSPPGYNKVATKYKIMKTILPATGIRSN